MLSLLLRVSNFIQPWSIPFPPRGREKLTHRLGPGLGRCSRSGFRPTGVLEGATGLPVGLHRSRDKIIFTASVVGPFFQNAPVSLSFIVAGVIIAAGLYVTALLLYQ